MEAMGRKLFQICDPNGKGFITKDDFKILVGELSLTPQQLDLVFDRLDTSKRGFITMSHFTESVSCFMTFGNDRREQELDCLQKLLQTNLLKRSSRHLLELNDFMREDQEGSFHTSWVDLIEHLNLDVQHAQEQMKELEVALNKKEQQRKNDLAFFESLQSEILCEKEIAVQKEKSRCDQLVAELKEKILDKESQCNQLMELKNELVDKFNSVFRKKRLYKSEIKSLKKDLNEKKDELECLKEQYSQLENDFKAMKLLIAEECQRSFQRGIKEGMNISDQEAKGVLEEIEILQSIANSLQTASHPPLVDAIS